MIKKTISQFSINVIYNQTEATTKIKNGTTYIRVRAYRKYKDSKKKSKKAYGDWLNMKLKMN